MTINDNEAAQAQVEAAPVKKKNGVLKRYEEIGRASCRERV